MTTQTPHTHTAWAQGGASLISTRISLASWFLIFAIPAFWSVNYLIARRAPLLIAPQALACARWLLAALMLLIFAWPELKAKQHLIWRERWHSLVLGILGVWICGSWVYLAARTTAATHIALIYAISPVFIVLGAALFLKEHLRFRQWLGAFLALVGLVHVVIHGRWQHITQTEFVAGDWWVLGCAIAWAAYSIFLKRWPSAFSPLARLVLIGAAGALFTLPLAVLEAASGLPQTQTIWSWQTAGLVLAAAALPGAGAYLGYGVLQKNIGAARTALVLYLGPFVCCAAILVGAWRALASLPRHWRSHYLAWNLFGITSKAADPNYLRSAKPLRFYFYR